jgi:hypothetical protein
MPGPYYGQSGFNPMQPMNRLTDPNNTTTVVLGSLVTLGYRG